MRQLDPDGAHIWLRQSVTFTAHDQTRTVEIAIPLPPGASPDEVEALLAEAGAGMDRLTRHLDARVAALLAGTAESEPTPAAPAAKPPAAAATTAPPAPAPPPSASAIRESAPGAAEITPPARPSAPAAARPAPPPAASTTRTPAATEPPAPPPAAPLALPEFIATAQSELGLNPRQAMEKLGVKTLSGLNLREALEMLRRQTLRDGDTPAPAPAAPASTRSAPANAEPPRYFDEEDDAPSISFTDEQEDDEEEADRLDPFGGYEPAAGPASNGSGPRDDLDDLDDVPDFGPPPSHTPTARRAQPASAAATPAPAPAAPQANASDTAAGSQTVQLMSELRAVRSGGIPSGQQRMAFRNIVIRELGEPDARFIVQGLWRLTPDKLGPEQIDALVSWGKRDTFADEAALVLAALRAERAPTNQPGGAPSVSPAASPRSGAPARPTTRGRAQPPKPPGE